MEVLKKEKVMLMMMMMITVITLMAAMCNTNFVSAANVTVGGSTGWDLSSNFSQWSGITPVSVNDSLLFIYNPTHDVIEVNEANFATCETRSPIGAYNDGETLINMTKPGPRYFVCGRSNHCTLGLKVRVQVLDIPKLHPKTSDPNETPDLSAARRYEDASWLIASFGFLMMFLVLVL